MDQTAADAASRTGLRRPRATTTGGETTASTAAEPAPMAAEPAPMTSEPATMTTDMAGFSFGTNPYLR